MERQTTEADELMVQYFAANGDGSVRHIAAKIARILEQEAAEDVAAGYSGYANRTEARQWRNRATAH